MFFCYVGSIHPQSSLSNAQTLYKPLITFIALHTHHTKFHSNYSSLATFQTCFTLGLLTCLQHACITVSLLKSVGGERAHETESVFPSVRAAKYKSQVNTPVTGVPIVVRHLQLFCTHSANRTSSRAVNRSDHTM